MNKVPLTVAGAEKLRQELQRLKTVDRPEVIAAIAEARSHGDLSENAEYDAAKERQGFIEGRIREVEASSPTRRSSIPSCSMRTAAAFLVRPSSSKIWIRVTR
jgi:transcription elongation GreA/GreB family factor